MKAAVLYGREDVRLEEVPLPTPGPGEVLLKIGSALTCGTDLKVFRNGTHARMIKPPALFGHEFSGTIEATGPGVTSWRKGMRAVAANSAPCRRCFFCQKDQPNLCEDLLFLNGAYAEFLKIPARIVQENLLEIPEGLSFQAAALTEPLACVLRGWEAVQPKRSETVALLGAGPVGLLFIQLAAGAGARVIVAGKGTRRLEAAKACGAEAVVNISERSDATQAILEATADGRGPDIVIEAVGRPAAWAQAISLVRPGGRVLLFGGCPAGTEVPLDARRMHYGELTLLSTFHHTPQAIRQALRLLAAGHVRAEPIVTRNAPLDDLPAVLRQMLADQDAVKTAILP